MTQRRTWYPRLLSAVAVTVVALAPGFAGVRSTGAASGAQGQISFIAAEYSTQTLPFWQTVIKNFEQANPGITVKLQMVGWQQMHDTTVRDIAAGQLPDLVNT